MRGVELLSQLANHPDILPWVAPGLDHVDVSEHDVPELVVVGDEAGAAMFKPIDDDPTIYQMHYLFTPAVRGAAAIKVIRKGFHVVFTEHGATAICGAVPREHRASRVMSRALGGRPIGTHTDFFGRPCIVYVLERATWAASLEASGH